MELCVVSMVSIAVLRRSATATCRTGCRCRPWLLVLLLLFAVTVTGIATVDAACSPVSSWTDLRNQIAEFTKPSIATKAPTPVPTTNPTKSPTHVPTKNPTTQPTHMPTKYPTTVPTKTPTRMPTFTPTKAPTMAPNVVPTKAPTKAPSGNPTKAPTNAPVANTSRMLADAYYDEVAVEELVKDFYREEEKDVIMGAGKGNVAAAAGSALLQPRTLVFCPFEVKKSLQDPPLQLTLPLLQIDKNSTDNDSNSSSSSRSSSLSAVWWSLSCETSQACIISGAGTHMALRTSSLTKTPPTSENSFSYPQLSVTGFVFTKATTSSLNVQLPSLTNLPPSLSSRVDLAVFQDCKWAFNNYVGDSDPSNMKGGAISVFPQLSSKVSSSATNDNYDYFNHGGSGSSSSSSSTIPSLTTFVVRLTSCVFYRNSANRGGAINHHHTAGRANQKGSGNNNNNNAAVDVLVVVSNSVFSKNSARTSGGTAIAITGSSVSPTLALQVRDGCRFVGNVDGSSAPRPTGPIQTLTTDGIVIEPRTVALKQNAGGCNGLYVSSRQKCISFSSVAYDLGTLNMYDHGLVFSQGLVAELIAVPGEKIGLTSPLAVDGSFVTSLSFHYLPDGAGIVALPQEDGGGFVYMSNSEEYSYNGGGVYGLYFDDQGRARDFKRLLSNTDWNCNGGLTPWQTWISCEEYPGGQCHQVHPTGARQPQTTLLGGSEGGQFEGVAVDNRNPKSPVFYLSEDAPAGAIRRFRPKAGMDATWPMLHTPGGTLDYLEFLSNNNFRWTSNLQNARDSASFYYQNVEGIAFRGENLMFSSKTQLELFTVNTKTNKWSKMSTVSGRLPGGGQLDSEPDQLSIGKDSYLYIAEDGSLNPGIYSYRDGKFVSVLETAASYLDYDELTGLNFSPDGMMFFFCVQHYGLMFRVRRIDGKSFRNHKIQKWKLSVR